MFSLWLCFGISKSNRRKIFEFIGIEGSKETDLYMACQVYVASLKTGEQILFLSLLQKSNHSSIEGKKDHLITGSKTSNHIPLTAVISLDFSFMF